MNFKPLALVLLSTAVWLTAQPGSYANEPTSAISVVVAQNIAQNQVEEGAELAAPESIEVSRAVFGLFQLDDKGNIVLTPTTQIPLIEGETYGWRIQLASYQGEVTWREVFQLPGRPQEWSGPIDGDFAIDPNGTEGITTYTEFTEDGWIENSWTVVSGDPAGQHRIEVYIDEQMIAAFEFEVVASAESPNQ